MRRITLLLATFTMLGGGTFAAIQGCSSSDATATPDAGSSTSSSSGDDNTSGTVNTSSSSSSSGTVIFDSGPPPLTVTSNPDQYTCGSITCDGGGPNDDPNNPPICCARPGVGGPGSVCVTSDNCDNEGLDASLQIQCDETADCTQNPGSTTPTVCCYDKQVAGQNGSRSTFSTACTRLRNCVNFDQTTGNPFQEPVLCKSAADCTDAGVDSGTAGTPAPCNVKTCDGFPLSVCGTPTGCQ